MGEYIRDERLEELKRAEEILDRILDAYDKYQCSRHQIDYNMLIDKLERAERERNHA